MVKKSGGGVEIRFAEPTFRKLLKRRVFDVHPQVIGWLWKQWKAERPRGNQHMEAK